MGLLPFLLLVEGEACPALSDWPSEPASPSPVPSFGPGPGFEPSEGVGAAEFEVELAVTSVTIRLPPEAPGNEFELDTWVLAA